MPATAAAKAPKKAPKAEKPAKGRTAGALGKPVTPSAELAAVVGAEPLARTAVVSKLWDYIRAHELQDPADRRGSALERWCDGALTRANPSAGRAARPSR